MATNTKTETKDLTEDAVGEIAKEKVIPAPELGGSFTFRMPYALDHFQVLRRRAEIVGIPESSAGDELLSYAHALAMFETYCIHEARKLDLAKEEPKVLTHFMAMMGEVSAWHDTFWGRVGPKKA